EADAYVRRGDWKIAFGVQYFLGQDIHHATLGIIGMGRIGQAVARRARGFDMQVLYNNRSRPRGCGRAPRAATAGRRRCAPLRSGCRGPRQVRERFAV
ncbi:MAG TPA: NAD(P)-dependent oxidoreductase, partial [Usitatibacter sp.]|nr:NAD(P)-dependent oxidoreductase [Usitatibacter sp.]